MSQLSDVQQSMAGQEKQVSSFTTDSPTLSMPQLPAKKNFVIFKLVKKKRRLHLHGVCDNVLNPKTKNRERIYLISGAHSIWQSELTDLLKDRDYINRNRRSILFEDGMAMVKVTDDRAVEYATHHTSNVGEKENGGGGKYDFYEYNVTKEQAKKHERQLKKIQMVVLVRDMKIEKVNKLASFFKISFVDEIGQHKGDEGIRTELMLYADNDPITFEKYIDSTEVEVSYMVKKAIIEGKIDLTGQSGNAVWAGGKGFIAKIPAARKPYEYLTELAMTNSDEGRAFKEQLQILVK